MYPVSILLQFLFSLIFMLFAVSLGADFPQRGATSGEWFSAILFNGLEWLLALAFLLSSLFLWWANVKQLFRAGLRDWRQRGISAPFIVHLFSFLTAGYILYAMHWLQTPLWIVAAGIVFTALVWKRSRARRSEAMRRESG